MQLFFVLSGFLITGILLDARVRTDAEGGRGYTMRNFYLRRALRLLPLLYAVITIVVFLQIPPIAESWPWHAFYLTNIYQWFYGWNGHGSHLWTLAVEEQFYIFWPIFILFVPRRVIVPCILVLVLVAPLFRYVIWSGDFSGDPNRLPMGAFDCLGLGALLAYVVRKRSSAMSRKFANLLLGIGVFGICGVRLFGAGFSLNQTFLACIFTWIVWQASIGFKGWIGRFLLWKPVSYIGKISYGIYVIQGFATAFWFWWLYEASIPGYRIFERLNISQEIYTHPIVPTLANIIITIGLAVVSWHFLEAPVNKLRNRFEYSKPMPVQNIRSRAGKDLKSYEQM